MATATTSSLITMAIPVKISSRNGRSMLVYALVDNTSDTCYASPEVLAKIGARLSATEPGETIHTMNGQQTVDLNRYDDINLTGFLNDNSTKISMYEREVYSTINLIYSMIATSTRCHLQGQQCSFDTLADQMPPLLYIPVGLLIGINHTQAIQLLKN